MSAGYRGAGDGQCVAIQNDGDRCTNGVYGRNPCCGTHKNVDEPTLAPEQDDRDWFRCPECGWQPADYAGAGSEPYCSECGVEFGLVTKWEDTENGREVATDGGFDVSTEGDYRTQAEELLDDVHGDRVFSVEEDVVWVSGMNSGCPRLARKMARTLVKHDIPAGLVYDDDAVQHGGVQFNYGDAA